MSGDMSECPMKKGAIKSKSVMKTGEGDASQCPVMHGQSNNDTNLLVPGKWIK